MTKANAAWPASVVEMWQIDRIVPYPNNPRRHPKNQIEQLARDMLEDGVTMPILVDEGGVVIAGHGRLLAALSNKFARYPVVIAKGWTDAQKKAARIKDNQTSALSSWDFDLLKSEFGELRCLQYDVNLLPFSEVDLRFFFGAIQSDDRAEDAPPVPRRPISKRGDLWRLGDHRILCGDAINADDVKLVLGGGRPHLMVTDPPYGVDYNPAWRDEAAKRSPSMGNRKDTAIGAVSNDHRANWSDAFKLFCGDVAYTWSAGLRSMDSIDALEDAGFVLRAQIIWAKEHLAISQGHYHFQHEPCWYAVRKGRTAHWSGGRKQTTLWTIQHRKSETGHGTQKPVECMLRPIVNNSKVGDLVYDPFVGSGTTIVAAETSERSAICLEIDPAYVDVCVQRWEQFSGGKAKRTKK